MSNGEIKSRGLYFVHGLYSENETKNEIIRDYALLHKYTIEDIYDVEEYFTSLENPIIRGQLVEGRYVLYDGETIQNADDNPTVMLYHSLYDSIISSLRENLSESVGIKENIKDVVSYHINVGHANCSLILFYTGYKCHLWMVDCAIKGCRSYKNYQRNLNECLDRIKNENNKCTIDKLLITHLHYDHINGIEHLVDTGWINKDTEVWINLNYKHNSPASINAFVHLNRLGVRIVDPIVGNSTANIKILYPNISFDNKNNCPPANNINNASVLYRIELGGNSMLFPGDIETEGWDSIKECYPYLSEPNYYCISHHGSKTGHIRKGCSAKTIRSVNNIAECLDNVSQCQILMGKDGTFNNVYYKDVLNDFKNIIKTDGCKYIEVKWGSGGIITN